MNTLLRSGNVVIFIYFVISVILAFSSYVIAQNLIISGLILITYLIYFLGYFDSYYKKNDFISKRYTECYNFINTFIISLSIKGTLLSSLEACELNQKETLKEALKKIEHINIEERLIYLGKYFPFYIYDLFLNIISLHQEQGGDILFSSKHLLKESRIIEEQKDQIFKSSIRKLGEIIILWGLTIVILIVIRFALSQFYDIILKNAFFGLSIGLFYAYMLFSLHFSLKRIFKTTVKGVKEIEKIKKAKRQHKNKKQQA